nr:2Fe-2S iron-sulfur cluster binding domain-containing protein [Saprospiraceae bacterium]
MENSEIVVFVTDREGSEHTIEVPVDMNLNLMEVMKGSDLDVKATCGGMALCSTCHVYVLSTHSLPEPTDAEEDMLDQAFDVEDNSRLGCQIKISAELNGLKVKLAPEGA